MSSPQHHPRVESFLLFTSLEIKVSQKPGQLGTLTLITLMRKVSGVLQCALWSWLQCCGAAVPGEWGRAWRRRMRILQHPEGSGPAAWWCLLQAVCVLPHTSVCSRVLLCTPVHSCPRLGSRTRPRVDGNERPGVAGTWEPEDTFRPPQQRVHGSHFTGIKMDWQTKKLK